MKFIERVLEGEILETEIDDFVEQWHESNSQESLADYLGFTDEEYALWVEQPETLRSIILRRKQRTMKTKHDLETKGKKLLKLLVGEIKRGRFKKGEPATFIPYSEVLKKLGIPPQPLAGVHLRREGLKELGEWLKEQPEIPKIDALIIDKSKKKPGFGYAPWYGHNESDWAKWWLEEAAKALDFDWEPYLQGVGLEYRPTSSKPLTLREGPEAVDFRKVITIEPGKRGGKPCVRGMRITVGDVLGWLAAGMSHEEIFSDFPELNEEDIRACLAFAAEKERHAVSLGA